MLVTIYLEADDEVTSVVRRLRAAEPGPTVIVAPGRSRATSSVVALRLLGRAADADARPLSVVGDALTRSLAAEAGLPAFGSLGDARQAEGGPAPAVEPRHASISVVRGRAAEDTVPTLDALPPSGAAADDLTRPVAVPASPSPPVPPRRRPPSRAGTRDRRVPIGVLAALVLLLVAATVAGAALLPAATVTIVPRSGVIGPVEYEIEVADAEPSRGTETATAEVVASGTYTVQEPASGTVVLFNWTYVAVEVPAGTFVAAGEQAFATQADVTVPPGQLTASGQIAAGDIAVAVLAAAPGTAGNVPAEAINVVVNQSTDARLRGFPNNSQPRVLNPEPTVGGADATGPEVTQEDVDAAVAALRSDLVTKVEEAIGPEDPDMITLEAPRGEPSIQLPEGLVGTRDVERVEISGELAWEVVRADPASVMSEARARLEADPSRVPDGHELLGESVDVQLGPASLSEGVLTVPASVSARSIGRIDVDEVRSRIAGRSAKAAEAAIADLGTVSVALWPGWVATVPSLPWRVEILIDEPAESGP